MPLIVEKRTGVVVSLAMPLPATPAASKRPGLAYQGLRVSSSHSTKTGPRDVSYLERVASIVTTMTPAAARETAPERAGVAARGWRALGFWAGRHAILFDTALAAALCSSWWWV